MSTRLLGPLVACALAGVSLGCGDPAAAPDAGAASAARATARLAGCNDPAVRGEVSLDEAATDEGIKLVTFELTVEGLPAGRHAVHIHETGACEPCGAAGGHFDPGPAGKPSPDGNHPFHSGDLVNVEVGTDGVGRLRTETTRITLSPGPLGIFDADGAAVIVHVDPDSYCPEGEVKGCAGGARAACGVLQRRSR